MHPRPLIVVLGLACIATTALGLTRPTDPVTLTRDIVYATRPATIPRGPVVLVECGGPALDRCADCGQASDGQGFGLSVDATGQHSAQCMSSNLHHWPIGGAIGPLRCDHHRPGDPGYGRPPAEFMGASSLGQVIVQLAVQGVLSAAWVIPPRVLLTAAADHCLAAAYAGMCPGVDPGELAQYRLRQRAEYLHSLPVGDPASQAVEAAIDNAGDACCDPDCWEWGLRAVYASTKAALQAAPRIRLGDVAGGPEVIDLRSVGTLPELREVLARTGQCAIYRLPRGPRFLVGLLGAGEGSIPGPGPAEAFLGGWAQAQGLVGIYPDHDGTPEGIRQASVRGYAGGYEVER